MSVVRTVLAHGCLATRPEKHDHGQRKIQITYNKYPVLERDASDSEGVEERGDLCILRVDILRHAFIFEALVAHIPVAPALRRTHRRESRSNRRLVQ